MKNILSKSLLGLMLTSSLLLTVTAQAENEESQPKPSSFRIISETIQGNQPMTMVLLSDDLIKSLKPQYALFKKSDDATKSEIQSSISGLLYLEAMGPNGDFTNSYCEVASNEYAQFRKEKDKELKPEIARIICAYVMDNRILAKQITEPYFLNSGNNNNLNRKITRLIRSVIIMLFDEYLAEMPRSEEKP